MGDEFFKGVGFYVGREGPELYVKTIERLGLYVSTQFKNGSDIKKCLLQKKLVKPTVPELAEKRTMHDKRLWEYRMGELIKTERVLEGNLCNLFAVLLSLCDSEVKDQVESSTKFSHLEKDLDTLGPLAAIKKRVYTRGNNDLNV